jgi:hypothetical protein
MWLAGFHGGFDDCGWRELTLSAALRDPFLNLLENVGDVEA